MALQIYRNKDVVEKAFSDEKFWYLYKDISPLLGKEDITQYVAKELLNILAWVNTKGGNDVV